MIINGAKFDPNAARLRPFPGGRGLDRSNPFIFIGSIKGVRKARIRKGSIICPLDLDPLAFQWPVAGLCVSVITDDDKTDIAIRLTQALIRDGAKLVGNYSAPSGRSSYHRQHEDAA